MNEPQKGPAPKSRTQIKLEHKYEVLENGDVKVIQEQIIEFVWTGRDFLTLQRSNENILEQTRILMSEEHITKLKKQEADLIEEIDKLKPIGIESETKTAIAYEEMIRKGMAESLSKAVNDTEIKENWWLNVWSRAKPERKRAARAALTAEERKLYVKVIHKLKRKGISIPK